MAFYFKPDEAAEDGIRRLVLEQTGKAMAEVADRGLDRADAVHQVRKRCKKVRAIVRLARSALGDDVYRTENVWFRDTARELSATRDTAAVLESFDLLMAAFEAKVDLGPFAAIRAAMAAGAAGSGASEDFVASRLNFAVRRLATARERVGDWDFQAHGFDALGPGLARV